MSMKLCVVCLFCFVFTLYIYEESEDFPSPKRSHLIHSTSHRAMMKSCWKVSRRERRKFGREKSLSESNRSVRMNENAFHQPHRMSRRARQQKKCVQFPSDWVSRVEMMKKFNLMFNSNSHPFFISFFPAVVTVPKMVIRFSIYMITNISECDFYGWVGGVWEERMAAKGWVWVE